MGACIMNVIQVTLAYPPAGGKQVYVNADRIQYVYSYEPRENSNYPNGKALIQFGGEEELVVLETTEQILSQITPS